MVINALRLMLILSLMLVLVPRAWSQCETIFTKPPSGNHNPGLTPPASLPASLGKFTCSKKGKSTSCSRSDSFTPGDYNFGAGDFKQGAFISSSGTTARLYFDSLSLNQADINYFGQAKNLFIYVRGNLNIAGQNRINAIVYVAGSVTVSGNASISGALAAGGSLTISGNGSVNVDLNAVQQADLKDMCNVTPPPPPAQLHHFEFDYGAFPLTCAPETLDVRACANSACSQLVTSAVSASLSPHPVPNGGWYVNGVNSNNLSFSNGLATVDLRHNVPGTVTIGVSSSSPTATSSTLCRKGTGPLDTASCTLSFADSGLLFDVPDKLANRPETVLISAVKKSDTSQSCEPAFVNVSKSVNFWSSYINPASVISGQSVTLNDTAIGKNSATKTSLNLSFDADGEAAVTVNYQDAGKLQLDAEYVGSGSELGLLMTGSDQFVSAPVGLCVTPEDALALCAAQDSTCAAYKKAGENFNLNIKAMAWEKDGDTDFCNNLINTPNYIQSNIALGSELVAPSGGVQGIVGLGSYNHIADSAASNRVGQSISEVGVFRFSATPPAAYLGSSFTLPQAKSAALGRFVPGSFVLSGQSVTPACGSFSYLDQPFPLAMVLGATNTLGAVTQNYQGVFAKGIASLVAENADNGVDLSTRFAPLAGTWSLGEMKFDASHKVSMLRLTAPGKDGPFELLNIGVRVADNDGNLAKIDAPDMNAATVGDCSLAGNCDARKLSQQQLRHGRMLLDNTYGPETEILNMPVRAEYWNGSGWITNADDNCTVVTPALGSQVDDSALGYNFEPDLLAGQDISRAGGAQVNNGQYSLSWQALGSPLYRGQVTAPLAVPDWLKWYWNWDGASPNTLADPRASAFFGRYRGHDKIIYWREVN